MAKESESGETEISLLVSIKMEKGRAKASFAGVMARYMRDPSKMILWKEMEYSYSLTEEDTKGTS